jgi:hypothetical protein
MDSKGNTWKGLQRLYPETFNHEGSVDKAEVHPGSG